MKKIFSLLFLIGLVFLVAGCEAKKETYSSNGFKITMHEGFTEKSLASATVYYESMEAILTALKEEFTILAAAGITENSTVEDYLTAVSANNQETYEIKTSGDIKYFTYEKAVNGKDFYYLAIGYKSNDAFWLVNFAAEKANQAKYEPLFLEWAKTVEFE